MHKADTIRTPALLLVTLLLAVFGTVFAVLPAGAQEGATEPSSEGEAAPADPPRVTLETNQGTLVLELFPDEAPKTVENFLAYAESGFYDGTVFHRVIPGFMIQGGGFTTDFQKKETRAPVENESDNGLSNTRGTVAMARTRDPHSATSQFFINVVDNASLDHSGPGTGYTVFGEVVEGMEVADAISKVPTSNRGRMADVPREAVVIEKVTVE